MKQRIAILAVMLALIGGYLWWQGRPADGTILYGNVDIRDVNLAFRVGGRVSEVLVDEGDVIEAGQLLARLDPVPLAHERDSARANLAAITAANALIHKGYRSEERDRARAEHHASALRRRRCRDPCGSGRCRAPRDPVGRGLRGLEEP